MVSIIIPTRNRWKVLKRTLPSYFEQELVTEIIVVDDNSDEDFSLELDSLSKTYPGVEIILKKRFIRGGAAQCRIDGVNLASNEYIAFGEDDAFFQKDYVKLLYREYLDYNSIGVIAGNIVYMEPGEEIGDARARFEEEIENQKIFDYRLLKFNPFSKVNETTEVPFVHALFFSKTELLLKHSFDNYYSKGNGYREETDFQMNIHLKGYKNFITNKVQCFHLSHRDVQEGGQRGNIFRKFAWTLFYNRYFLNKYYKKFKKKHGMQNGIVMANIIFFKDQVLEIFVKPSLRRFFNLWR